MVVEFDFGQVVLTVDALVKGVRGPLNVRWSFGPVVEHHGPVPPSNTNRPPPSRKGSIDMDANLLAGQSAAFHLEGEDRFHNPVPLTGDDAVAFSLDPGGELLVSLTDNGDGSGAVTSLGPVGTTVLHVADTLTNGETVLGAAAVLVTAGRVSVVNFVFDAPTDPA